MAKDPGGRYQSADDMAEDMREQKCDGMFATDPTAGASYPSPFGIPPAQIPQQQAPSSPYGTPVPSAGSGAAYPPDPFATPAPPSTAPSPPMPPRPVMSPDTRNFLGILLLTIGVAGMVVFAIWAISHAYRAYEIAQTSEAAGRYYGQAVKLHNQGRLEEAEGQYQNAIRVSPKSKAAENARVGLYKIWVARAFSYSKVSNRDKLVELARKMVGADPKGPEGHYYLGLAYELSREYSDAASEFEQASVLAGNDQAGYGSAARARLEQVKQYQNQTQQGNADSAPPQAQPLQEKPLIPYSPGGDTEGQ